MTVTGSQADALDAAPAPDLVADLGRRVRRLQLAVTALVLVVLLGAIAAGAVVWSRSSTPSQTSPDVGFARDMYTHHGQAVTMGLMMRNTVGEPFNTLTEDIVTGQSEQQGIMLGWLQDHDVLAADDTWEPMAWMAGTPGMDAMSSHGGSMVTDGPTPAPSSSPAATSVVAWGQMPGMASDAELTRLAELKGRPREVLFLQLMLRHHRAGTDMARTYLDLGSDPQLRELARSIVTSQDREISIMTGLLADRGATATS